jgi:hypothetical protein
LLEIVEILARGGNVAMLLRLDTRKLLTGIALLCIGVLSFSLAFATPVSAQQGEFVGRYDYTLTLEGMDLQCEMDMYRYLSNDSLETYFGTYSQQYVTHRPDYRLEHSSSGYIDISNHYSYTSLSGDQIKSEMTYSLHLSGYQEVAFTSMYEFGNHNTITDNDTLFEETYTERYYEDGDYVESTDYHEYTFLEMSNDTMRTENVTVDAGEFECLILDIYVFEGIDTDIDVNEDWDYFQGGPIVWIDTEEGHIVQQMDFDEYYDLVAELYLISLDDPRPPLGTGLDSNLIIIGGGAGAAVIVVAVIVRSRSGSKAGNAGPSFYE